MERELRDPSIEKFPFPPKYYKEFDTEFKYKSPDLRILQKLDKFKTFGTEYNNNNKQIDNFLFTIDNSFIAKFPKFKDYIKNKKITIPNENYFKNLNSIDNLNNDNVNQINAINELEKEINFLKERYKIMIENISKNIEYSQYESNLIKMSYQKIFFYLRLLKKKQILNETIKYFHKEIEKNEKIEKQLKENLNNFHLILKNTLNEVNNNIKQYSINSNININNNNLNNNNNNNNINLMDEDSFI